MSYLPLDRGILTSSLWAQGTPEQVKVWLYLLLAADPRTGIVEDADPAIALRCSLPLDVVTAALDWLASPDPYSRTKDHEGRRIERPPEGGLRLVNYLKHRDKDYSTPRVQAFRERQAAAAQAEDETAKRVSSVLETVGNDGHGHGHGHGHEQRKNDIVPLERDGSLTEAARTVWTRVRQQLEAELPAHETATWLRPLEGRDEGGVLVVRLIGAQDAPPSSVRAFERGFPYLELLRAAAIAAGCRDARLVCA